MLSGFRGWHGRSAVVALCVSAVSASTLITLTLRETALNVRYGVEDEGVGNDVEKGWEGRLILTSCLPNGRVVGCPRFHSGCCDKMPQQSNF